MNTRDIFCTHEQVKRISELVPDIEHLFVLNIVHGDITLAKINVLKKQIDDTVLTFTELRDLIWRINEEYQKKHKKDIFDYYDYEYNCKHASVTEFADWVIETLEEVSK